MPNRLVRSLQRWRPFGLPPHRWRLAPWYWRGLQVTLEPGSAIAWIVRLTGGFEETEIDIAAALYSALYPDRCILEANVGIHSLAWARLAPVVALEPAPGTHSRLEANVAANGLQDRIRTLRTAAGDAVGEVDFFVAADSAFSSLNDTGRIRIRERTRVPCTTLDALAAELPLPVGLLKIDVEGLERAVIAGAAELLRRDRPVLLIRTRNGPLRTSARTVTNRSSTPTMRGCSPTNGTATTGTATSLFRAGRDSWRRLPLSTSSACPGRLRCWVAVASRAKRAWARGGRYAGAADVSAAR